METANGSYFSSVRDEKRRVGVGKERPTGSTAVGKKSVCRNKSGKPNDTAKTSPGLRLTATRFEWRLQVEGNDLRMPLFKIPVKLRHSYHVFIINIGALTNGKAPEFYFGSWRFEPVPPTSGVFDPQCLKSGGYMADASGTHPSNKGNDTRYN